MNPQTPNPQPQDVEAAAERVVDGWHRQFNPSRSALVNILAAAITQARQCPHCDEQFKELLERREAEIERLNLELAKAREDGAAGSEEGGVSDGASAHRCGRESLVLGSGHKTG